MTLGRVHHLQVIKMKAKLTLQQLNFTRYKKRPCKQEHLFATVSLTHVSKLQWTHGQGRVIPLKCLLSVDPVRNLACSNCALAWIIRIGKTNYLYFKLNIFYIYQITRFSQNLKRNSSETIKTAHCNSDMTQCTKSFTAEKRTS